MSGYGTLTSGKDDRYSVAFPAAFLHRILLCKTKEQVAEAVETFARINGVNEKFAWYSLAKSLFEKGVFYEIKPDVQDFVLEKGLEIVVEDLFAPYRAVKVSDLFSSGNKRDPHLLAGLISAIFEGIFINEESVNESVVVSPKSMPKLRVRMNDYVSLVCNKLARKTKNR
jgi:hypothetical protein